MMRRIALLVLAAVAVLPGRAQAPSEQDPYRLRVDVRLVQLNVRVKPPAGEMPPVLAASDFVVREDGREQSLRVFETPEGVARVVLVLDTSVSTREKLGTIKKATEAFLSQLADSDEVALVTVGGEAQVAQDFTSDRRLLRRSIRGLETRCCGTPFYGGLSRGFDLVASQRRRSLVVAFSDGMNSNSQASYPEVLQRVLEGAGSFYAISLNTLEDERKRMQEMLKVLAAGQDLIVVLDLTTSDGEERQAIREAALYFLGEIQPNNRVAVLQFLQQKLRILTDGDSPVVARRLLEKEGGTPTGRQLSPRRRAGFGARLIQSGAGEGVVIFTDGLRSGVEPLGDYLRIASAGVIAVKQEDSAGVQARIRSLIRERIDVRARIEADMEALPGFFARSQERLREIAEASGGEYLLLQKVDALKEAYAGIAAELRNTYLLGYYSSARPGHHRLEVEVPGKAVGVRTRRAFFVPFEPE